MFTYLVLQRHLVIEAGEAAFIVAAPGLRLALPSPARPVQTKGGVGCGMQHHGEQTPHLWDGHRDQVGLPPFWASTATACVTSRKAWANRQSVIWRCHPAQRRTSY